MARLIKRYPFSASHRLHVPEFSEEENDRLFGKCNNPYGHGHNYIVEVAVRGPVDAQSGMVVRRADLDRFVEKQVLSKIDHVDLNKDVAEFQNAVPTTENLILIIKRWLLEGWDAEFGTQGPQLGGVRVEETARNSFEVKD